MRFIFPFAEIEKNSRIVLYGASEMGYDFYRQIVTTGYCTIALWVDRQYEWWQHLDLPVSKPDDILNANYDKIILTAEKQSVAQSMRDDLSALGVDSERILWKSDYLIKGNIARKFDIKTQVLDSQRAIETSPREFVDENNLDIVIRVIYARSVLAGDNDLTHKELYKKLITKQTELVEATDRMLVGYFSEYDTKRGWDQFDMSFRELIDSIRNKGFQKEYFIPLDNKKHLLNGRHRIAAAMALGVSIWTVTYPFSTGAVKYDVEWLKTNDFSGDEIRMVLAALEELKKAS
ncbi:hypothetical protein [Butyrivibrio fibrisolvens]|uniref:Uncharacterized protein n=1 Tax=Butyrivibrio fibrisolvens TaxID=831 RepID=A0A317G747_BUTFI|nr:hypothetical protein [Butyrivibrio fibrisolvens]PWT29259.1 hypothetical protein CPT75_20225 [Butyrivibrio fibrisolvens]